MNILDFEKAEDTLGSTFYEDRGVVKALVAALESQAQAAVAEVRAEYAPLIAKVREWRDATNAAQAATCAGDTMTAEEKQSCFSWATKAEDALASHPLSEEG